MVSRLTKISEPPRRGLGVSGKTPRKVFAGQKPAV